MQSMTIFLYCSLSSLRSLTRRLTISAPPTLLAISTVVSTSYRSHMTSHDIIVQIWAHTTNTGQKYATAIQKITAK